MQSNDKCMLCGKSSNLKESHILPEWAYKNTYDNNHRFFQLSMAEETFYGLKQKGIKQYLFCESCEQLFSRYENYSKHLFFSIMNNSFRNIEFSKVNEAKWLIKGVDYFLVKQFFLSLLYRMCISTNNMFKFYNIEKNKLESIRLVLSKEQLTPITYYPIAIGKPFYNNTYLDNVILTQASNSQHMGYETIRVMFSGLYISMYLSEHLKNEDILGNCIKSEAFILHRVNVENHFDGEILTKLFINNEQMRSFYEF